MAVSLQGPQHCEALVSSADLLFTSRRPQSQPFFSPPLSFSFCKMGLELGGRLESF